MRERHVVTSTVIDGVKMGLYEGECCDVGMCLRPPGHDGYHDSFDSPRSVDSVPLHPLDGMTNMERELHDARNEAQRYLCERDEVQEKHDKALDIIEEHARVLFEVHQELDKQGAPPGPFAHQRLRELARVDKVSREQVQDALGLQEALERALGEISMLKEALAASEAARQRAEYALTEAPRRREVDRSLQGITHHFSVAGHDGYLTVNFFSDKTPGEFFIKIAKEGSTMSGLFDTLARLASKSLQRGVPLVSVCRTLVGQSFEPKGMTGNPDIPKVESIVDYVGRWLVKKYVDEKEWQAYLSKEKPAIKFAADSHVGGAE